MRTHSIVTITLAALLSTALFAADDPAAPADRPARRDPSPPPPNRPDPAPFFARLDTDQDGKLSKTEWQRLVAVSPRLNSNPADAEQAFKTFDEDADGKLSLDEFRAMSERAPGQPPPAMRDGMRPDGMRPDGMRPGDRRPPFMRRPGGPGANDSVRLTAEQTEFFEKKIRPVLVGSCYQCHSTESKKSKGGLLLDTRDGIRKGGDKGPAVVPGKPDDSLLLTAIHWTEEDFQMPPKKKLADDVIADFQKWVAMGAPDPRDGRAVVRSEIDIEKGRQFWAFQQPRASAPPAVKGASWPKSDVDRHLLAAMESKGVKPVADADSATLLRRVTFDLTGLPPTPAEVEAFLGDAAPGALETVVDRLLASPAFGERWGRHWLDVARFGESSGKQVNVNYPHAWRYRDWVIDSFATDKPYDRFVREQIAGDLMSSPDDKTRADRQIATGYLAIGTKNHNERSRIQFELDTVDEQIDALSQGILGTTLACARCHDHKFDPIAQRDYYAVAGIFRSTETLFGTVRVLQNNHVTPLIELPNAAGELAGTRGITAQERQRIEDQISQLGAQREEIFKGGRQAAMGNVQLVFLSSRIAQLQNTLAIHNPDGSPKVLAMGARDRYRPLDSPIYTRGETDQPGPIIARGLPQVMVAGAGEIRSRGSGRLELAEWIGSEQSPLTARVWVNRVWLHLFGQGIVPTPDNFGASGVAPTNQPLLDNLAVWFMKEGWSTKKLIRMLVMTRAYQLASTYDSLNYEIDPDNVLNWRASTRRLEAESLRDAMLTVAGRLDTSRPTASPVARFGDGPSQTMLRFGDQIDNDSNHRSVYLPIVRDQLPEVLATFDFAEPSMVVGQRATTSVPSQSLYLLNSPFVINAADSAASKLAREIPDERQRIRVAYLSIYNRPPTPQESAAAEKFLNDYAATISSAASVTPAARRDAWTAMIQSLLGSSEFLYLN